MNKIGFYAGSFDPITKGHLSVVANAVKLFDKLIVAVGVNPSKTSLFTQEEREDLTRQCVNGWGYDGDDFQCPIEVISFKNRYLAHVAMDCGATHIVRGIRSAADFENEYIQSVFNRKLAADYPKNRAFRTHSWLETVFLPTDPMNAHISSSAVKSLLNCEGWEAAIAEYVLPPVLKALQNKYESKTGI